MILTLQVTVRAIRQILSSCSSETEQGTRQERAKNAQRTGVRHPVIMQWVREKDRTRRIQRQKVKNGARRNEDT